jgi:hypothetical protein
MSVPLREPLDTASKSAVDGFLLLAGAGFVVAGSFLPWAKITAVLVGTITKSGTDGGDGWLTILLAVPLAIFGFRRVSAAKTAIPRVPSLGFALALGALTVFEIQNATSRVNTANAAVGVYGHAAVGVGLWVLLLGSALGIVGSLVTFRRRKIGPS